MRITGVYNFISRIMMTLAVTVAAVFGSLPVTVQAAPDPIDLELDATGSTPIIVNNVLPGDSGVKTVELRNVGTDDGLVYIWLSDIIDSEGLNPDSETGDTSGDGELGEYLLLDINISGLSTNLALPATVNDFPTSAADQKYIKVITLEAGETRTLEWNWELPIETGNMVQGDELSFTINYTLREIESNGGVTGGSDVPGTTPFIGEEVEEEEKIYKTLEVTLFDGKSVVEIDEDGFIKDSLVITDDDGLIILNLPAGTRITGIGGIPLDRIELTVEELPLLLPADTVRLSLIYQLIGYDTDGNSVQLYFDPPVRLTLRYDPEQLPENSYPPYIAQYTEEEGLKPLESLVRYPDSLGRIDALIAQFSLFMALADIAPEPPPLPVNFTASNLIISPHKAFEGDPMNISVTIKNEGVEDGSYELYLIIDGIVRAIQEVSLSGKSSKTLTFEITNLAAGTHQIKVAGLTENIRIEQVAVNQLGPGVNWTLLDLSVGGVVIAGMLVWFLYMIRARRRETEIGI